MKQSYLRRFVSILPAALLLIASQSHAAFEQQDELGPIGVSILGGDVSLYRDPGYRGELSWGLGVAADYTMNEDFRLEARYVASSNRNVDHSEIAISGLFDLPFDVPEEWNIYLPAGVGFYSNDIKDPRVAGQAFGIAVGIGAEYTLMRQLTIGPEVRYQKLVSSNTRVRGPGQPSDASIHTVDDSATFLVKLRYRFTLLD